MKQTGSTLELGSLSRKAPQGPAPHLGCRVLLAEDGTDNQKLLSRLLARAGARVTVVEHGEQAVEHAMSAAQGGDPFAVILMDMQMPVMDGYEATRQLRARGYRGAIIAFTADAFPGVRQRCREVGCDAYMNKPVSRSSLIRAVSFWSGQSLAVDSTSTTDHNGRSPLRVNTFSASKLNVRDS